MLMRDAEKRNTPHMAADGKYENYPSYTPYGAYGTYPSTADATAAKMEMAKRHEMIMDIGMSRSRTSPQEIGTDIHSIQAAPRSATTTMTKEARLIRVGSAVRSMVRKDSLPCRSIVMARMGRMSKSCFSSSLTSFGVELMEIGVVHTRSTRIMTRTSALRVGRHTSMVWENRKGYPEDAGQN
jgi:hypothetical protein